MCRTTQFVSIPHTFKLNTGMNRLGFTEKDFPQLILNLKI